MRLLCTTITTLTLILAGCTKTAPKAEEGQTGSSGVPAAPATAQVPGNAPAAAPAKATGASPAELAKPEPSTDYKVTDVVNGGTIKGVIKFTGEKPPTRVMSVTKQQDICGKDARRVGGVVVTDSGALRGAVAFISGIKAGKPWPEGDMTEVDQLACKFITTNAVVRRGSKVRVTNSDPVLHNVHAYEMRKHTRRNLFNVAQPEKGHVIEKTIKIRRGDMLKLECDAHDFMHMWILALDAPYFGAAADDGTFTIENVPAGQHRVRAWHPELGKIEAVVDVPAGGEVTADLTYER